MKKKLDWLVLVISRQSVIYGLIAIIVAALMLYRLGTLVPNFSQPELDARAAASSLKHLAENPLFLPHKILQYLLIKLGQSGAFWMRLPSVMFAVLALLAFYRILLTWYSRRIALLCSFLFLSSAWFLHFARLGTPDILYAGSVGLLWAGIQLKGNYSRARTIVACSLIGLGSLYVPGLVWLVAPMLIWQRKLIGSELRELPAKLQLGLVVFGVLALAPLIYGFVNDLSLIRAWLAIPEVLSKAAIIHNAWHIPVWLVILGPNNPIYWLGHVPLLDSFSVLMFLLGLYLYRYYWLLDRVRAIVLFGIVGTGLAVLNGPWQLIMLAPIIYLIVASGIAFLLQQWFRVFPRNPLSRWVGVGLVGAVILLAGYYHLSHYFIAWPRTPVTRAAYQAKQ